MKTTKEQRAAAGRRIGHSVERTKRGAEDPGTVHAWLRFTRDLLSDFRVFERRARGGC